MWGILHHWLLPLGACIIWWGMLIALLTCWAAQGHPIYDWITHRNIHVLYISDVSATNLQPIFISCSGAQGILYVLSLVSERYLRHAGRLLPNERRREKVLAAFSIFFGIIGQLGILFVAIFNTKVFPDVHVAMLCVFIVGVGISALFMIAEFALLDRAYPDVSRLRFSYVLKLVWFVIALGLVIAFAALADHGKRNSAAIVEWIISYFYGFYLLILVFDLIPAATTPKGKLLEKKVSNQLTRALSWIPGVPVVQTEPPFNAAEMAERAEVGDIVLGHRAHHGSEPEV
ncbi:Sfk1p [Sugiyamaella lignohabitans]|uniref:Sfk1p n=1 Tax=Sugiyamaella lignohabitans TaxID=796027 RepID=A0A161HHX6_9ASCO|nr:Sfk1p [Sugiyamaella lignohabitans]ANB15750.1 Sfk1p [Sugiyamaella lignohabitans]